jgi:single-stranded DNA-binding protein
MTIHCGFTGTLTANAVKKITKEGKPWVYLNVRTGAGQDTQFTTVSVFGDAGNIASLKQGAGVFVEGRIELRRWESKTGQNAELRVIASYCRPIDLRGGRQ